MALSDLYKTGYGSVGYNPQEILRGEGGNYTVGQGTQEGGGDLTSFTGDPRQNQLDFNGMSRIGDVNKFIDSARAMGINLPPDFRASTHTDPELGGMAPTSIVGPVIQQLAGMQKQHAGGDFWNGAGPWGLPLLAAGPISGAAGAGSAFGGFASAGAADAAGLAQMAADAGLTGQAAQAFIASGGTLGSTSALAAGDAAWGVNPQGATPGTGAEGATQSLSPWEQSYRNLTQNIPDWLKPTPAGLATSAGTSFLQNGFGSAADMTNLPTGDALGTTPTGSSSSWLDQLLTPANAVRAGVGLAGVAGNLFASNKAVDAQTNAANQANQTLQQFWNAGAPYREAGAGAVGRLSDLTTPGKQADAVRNDPGAQFQMEQWKKNFENANASHWQNGATVKAATDYYNNKSLDQINNVYNRNSSLASLGLQATGMGGTAASQIANNQLGVGNAQSAGAVSNANAFTNALGQFSAGMSQDALWKAYLGRSSGYG